MIQSFIATLSVFIVLYFLSLQHAVIIASIGASAFIVFAMPNNITAQSRNLIGGQVIGLLCGFVFSLPGPSGPLMTLFLYSLAVGSAIFLMVVLDMEHPPAAGTALGVAMTGMPLEVFVVVILSIVLLSLIHKFFKPYLKDLT